MPSVTRAPIERRIVSGGQIPVTFECVFKSQWAAITSQISCKGITVLSAYCQLLHWKRFALHFHIKISQAFYGSLGQSVKNTYPLCTVSFYKNGTFSSPVLLMLNILFFLPIWGWKYSCITLKFFECRFRFSMYWVINVPFIELLLALSIWHIIH